MDSINNGADETGAAVCSRSRSRKLTNGAGEAEAFELFVWHTAEEKGCGAQYYADHPTVSRDSIVAQVNIDQSASAIRSTPAGGPKELGMIGPRRLSTELGDMVER